MVVSVKKGGMPSNQLHFFWKKNPVWLTVHFIDKSISPCFVLNLWNISAMCCGICQLMRCQKSIMENRKRIKILFTYEIAISSSSTQLVKWICPRAEISSLAPLMPDIHGLSFVSLYSESHFLEWMIHFIWNSFYLWYNKVDQIQFPAWQFLIIECDAILTYWWHLLNSSTSVDPECILNV